MVVLLWISMARILNADGFEDGLLAYWRFEENLGDGTGVHYGVGQGAEPITYADGKFGKALYLNGIDQAVKIVGVDQAARIVGGHEQTFDLIPGETSFSLSLWCIGSPGLDPWAEVISKGQGTWRVGKDGRSGLLCSVGLSVGGDLDAEVETLFQHVVIVYEKESNTARFYLNGKVQVRDVCSVASSNHDVYVGGGPWPYDSGHWRGTIDDVAIWNRSLAEHEVLQLWNDGKGIELWQILSDLDEDGMYDPWETSHGLDLGADDSEFDLDGDGLLNHEEFKMNTDPTNPDSDNDGLGDAIETRRGVHLSHDLLGTDPNLFDTDFDGLSDSDPLDPDTLITDSDGDGFNDGFELNYGSSATDAKSTPGLRADLVAYFPFDGNCEEIVGGATQVVSVPSNSELRYEKGVFGNALQLDGSGGLVANSGDEAFDFRASSGFSISCWVMNRNMLGNPAALLGATKTIRGWSGLPIDLKSSLFRQQRQAMRLCVARLAVQFCKEPAHRRLQLSTTRFSHLVVSYEFERGHATYFVNGTTGVDVEESAVGIRRKGSGLQIGGVVYADQSALGSLWEGLIDELAIWSRPLSEREAMLLWNDGEGRSLNSLIDEADVDSDGMRDSWELDYGLVVGVDDSGGDLDGDGASNLKEYEADTDPGDPDTDDDGLLDGVEDGSGVWLDASRRGTSPRNVDSDGDGLPDGVENPDRMHTNALQSSSDPNRIDTDGDGHTDEAESRFGAHPGDPQNIPAIGAGLLTHWAFDNNLAEPVRGLAGTAEGEVAFEPGRFGQALWLDGNGSVLVDERSIDELDFGDESFSIGMWMRLAPRSLPNNGKWETLIGKGTGATWRFDRGDEGDVSFHPGWEYGIAPAWQGIRLNDDRLPSLGSCSRSGAESVALLHRWSET